MNNHTDTIEYYNTNTADFFSGTVSADLTDLYDHFLNNIPDGGKILDFGCGSGRDTKAFVDRGYEVDAIDGSFELCKMATEFTGIQVKMMDFFELDVDNVYDGIWACASLLHVEPERLPELLSILQKALTTDGVLYMSFKYGSFAGMRNGRYFADWNEEKAKQLLDSVNGWKLIEMWQSQDVRKERSKDWLNILLRKNM